MRTILTLAVLSMSFLAFGQPIKSAHSSAAAAEAAMTAIPGATDAVPNAELAKLLLVVIVPALVALGKWLLPKLPKPAIPILAIALGSAADYAGSLLGAWNGSFVIGAVLGSAAVGLREIGHQFMLWNTPPSETQNPS